MNTEVTMTETSGLWLNALIKRAFNTSLVIKAQQWFCAHGSMGHTYRVSLVASEDDALFTMDPLTTCANCDIAMSAEAFNKMVSGYDKLRAQEMEDDELW